MDPEKCGGYNAHFLHEILDEYECPVCIMALREPVITLCGHRLCFSCSEEIKKRNNGILICPLDKTILNSEKVFPDKFTERAILQLKVKCNNFLKSCQWTGELKRINNHLTSCEYQEVKCLNEQCSTTLLRKELSDHIEKHCIYRLVTCRYCKQKIVFCDKQIHEEKCEYLPLCCVNQCGIEILRKEMSSHIIDSCANTIIPCQYSNIGCKFKGMRKEHETHANSSMQNHLSLAISKLDALENKITLTVNTLENKIASKVNALENKIMSKVESLETKIAAKTVALENKITSTVESFENKNASEVVALEMKIKSTVDALKNELILKVDAQKDKIMLHEKNLEVIKAFLATEAVRKDDGYDFDDFYTSILTNKMPVLEPFFWELILSPKNLEKPALRETLRTTSVILLQNLVQYGRTADNTRSKRSENRMWKEIQFELKQYYKNTTQNINIK